ncbi:hypothetical protein OPV22_007646 [Ensete ventricosum]|uniref:Uncharacterized protein n=1 Tax=Ensete ventricosum TaxID=4639 RepID=A0AAV8RUZ5_ENSVE|nr:hypothetical protein OPV22_007646 [Ensete ventricosum]
MHTLSPLAQLTPPSSTSWPPLATLCLSSLYFWLCHHSSRFLQHEEEQKLERVVGRKSIDFAGGPTGRFSNGYTIVDEIGFRPRHLPNRFLCSPDRASSLGELSFKLRVSISCPVFASRSRGLGSSLAPPGSLGVSLDPSPGGMNI